MQKNYSLTDVRKATLEYFSGDELSTDVWIKKYCLKDSEGNFYELTPNDMHWRLAHEIYRIECKYPNALKLEEIFDSIKNFKRIVPQGSPMSGIGNNFQVVSISNCFVIGSKNDSYGGIMKIDQDTAQLEKRRGGVGTDLSFIRPKGSPVKNSAITSTGVVPFMERFSNTTKEVAQDGRRGALMLSISTKHPDSEAFIDAKLTEGKVSGANVSVKIDNEFMKSVLDGTPYLQQFPIDSLTPKYTKEVNASNIWKKIIYNAWKSAEPGILFWDNIINESIPDCYSSFGFKTTSTNPCGEIPLCPYDSCRLVAINLYNYVIEPFTKFSRFDLVSFRADVNRAMRYMDDIVDLEIEKIDKILEKIKSDPEDEFIKLYEIDLWEKIREKAVDGRRTGLGITGMGDMLAALGYTYGTDKATDFAEYIVRELKLGAYRTSVTLAKERGAFPIYNAELEENNPFIQRIKNEDIDLYTEMQEYGRRNIALLTISPTGTVSLMTMTTSGIEPVFLPIYRRRRKINPAEKNIRIDFVDAEGVAWTEYPVFHHNLITWFIANGYDMNIIKSLTVNQVEEFVKTSPYHKATSNDVDWVKKVEMQGRIQKHIDHSISVTVNLPENTTEEIVAKVYEAGWKSGCKGITVYREGSRDGVLIPATTKEQQAIETSFKEHNAPKRPKRVKGDIIRFQNNLEKWIAVVGIIDGRPYELFTGRNENGLSNLPPYVKECEIVKNILEDGSKRYDIEFYDSEGKKQIATGISHQFNPEFWNYAKLISSILRHGMPLVYVYELIESLNLNSEHLNTWKNGVARVIKRYIKDGVKVKGTCQECGSTDLEFKEGCMTCVACGSSKCS